MDIAICKIIEAAAFDFLSVFSSISLHSIDFSLDLIDFHVCFDFNMLCYVYDLYFSSINFNFSSNRKR